MDTESLLNSIFEEYKEKCIVDGRREQEINAQLDIIRKRVEEGVRESTEDLIGRPASDETRQAIRLMINQNLNHFLDAEIRINSIDFDDAGEVTVDMSYISRESISGKHPEVKNHIIIDNDPMPKIISSML